MRKDVRFRCGAQPVVKQERGDRVGEHVRSAMVAACRCGEILWAIVAAIAVQVMNVNRRGQLHASRCFVNVSMFQYIAVTVRGLVVRLVDPNVAALHSGSASVPSRVRRASFRERVLRVVAMNPAHRIADVLVVARARCFRDACSPSAAALARSCRWRPSVRRLHSGESPCFTESDYSLRRSEFQVVLQDVFRFAFSMARLWRDGLAATTLTDGHAPLFPVFQLTTVSCSVGGYLYRQHTR